MEEELSYDFFAYTCLPPVTKATFPVSEAVSSRLKLWYVMRPLILVCLGQLGDGGKYTDVGQ